MPHVKQRTVHILKNESTVWWRQSRGARTLDGLGRCLGYDRWWQCWRWCLFVDVAVVLDLRLSLDLAVNLGNVRVV